MVFGSGIDSWRQNNNNGKKLTKVEFLRNYQIKLDFDRENHVWVALSLYEHWFKMVHVDSQIKEFLKFKSKILPIVSSSFWDTNYYLHLNYVYIIDWPNQFISV